MADNGANSKTISQTNSGFPDYLNFDTLRSDAIDYLGNLTGKIWTDYNLHDPGITIIEMLCYALLDLGYRTNFPAADIFTRDPSDTSPTDNNFFTPAQILTCNPLTIIDYRKMLIDLNGVKNAWLEIDDCQTDLCRNNRQQNPSEVNNNGCKTFLNGLYRVYIELENAKPTASETNDILDNVKNALMSHRNFCEDFVDIYILCAFEIGVCADIELEIDADAETVYKNIILALQEFFSPSPKFYTLQQLLDKKTPIEDIFSGRPYNLSESHGFVDTSEFELIKLKKEIHLSDVYQTIFNIDGVKTVNRLRLQNCKDKSQKINWKFQLPQNSIPDFSIKCSAFQFSQNGKAIQQDLTKFNQYLDVSFSDAAKILYQSPSPYLDATIPKGIYRSDLGDYYSIQNEFPRVYGIGDGGLPSNASNERQAQALQLKGYLLFFDQLLADYLSQLQNIRSLFSLTASESDQPDQTYFLQRAASVPDLDKLIIKVDSVNTLGIPVSKKHLHDVLKKNPLDVDKLTKIISTPYSFASLDETDIATKQLAEDLLNGNFDIDTHQDFSKNILQIDTDCWIFFVFTSSEEIAIVSSGNFSSIAEANQTLTSLQYLATFKKNCNSYLTSDGNFSFNISSNLSGYANFLQLIIENKALYRERKGEFLDHLLSRFAEQFTDYALLSYNFMKPHELEDAVLKQKQNFLAEYDELSSNRGRAYNYSTNHRGDEVVSGFENRVTALAGFNSKNNSALCNFVVEEFEEQFIVHLKFGNKSFFKSPEKFYSTEQAESSAKSLFTALHSDNNYEVFFDKEKYAYAIKVFCNNNKEAFFEELDADKDKMHFIKKSLVRFFSIKPFDSDIFVSQKVFRIIIRNSKPGNEEIFSSKQFFTDFRKAKYTNISRSIISPSFWNASEKNNISFKKIYLDKTDPEKLQFINLDAFKIDIDADILEKPDKFSFALLDHKNNFKFFSLKEFDSSKQAEENCKHLIILLANISNLKIENDKRIDKYFLRVVVDDDVIAQSTAYDNDVLVQKAKNAINKLAKDQLYLLSIEERNYRWQSEFYLNNEKGDEYLFRSSVQFESPDTARSNVKDFFDAIQNVSSEIVAGELQLTSSKKTNTSAFIYNDKENKNSELKKIKAKVDELLELKKEIITLDKTEKLSDYEKFTDNDILNKEQKYVYRLVDKNHLHAVYVKEDILDNTKDAATAKKKELFQDISNYDYLDICLGGDIFKERIDKKTGATWYHYQIKSRNILFSVKDFVLFESVQGYTSEDEAQQAFDANYLMILSKAMHAENYGEEKYISIKEVIVHIPDPTKEIKSVVFIPDKTKEIFSWYNENELKKEFIKLAKKYPVRFVTNSKNDDDKFKKLFPCESSVYIPDSDPCDSENVIVNYYFYVLTDKDGNEIWQSVRHYKTTDEARSRFYFFYRLLFYPGNYIVKESLCHCFKKDKKDCACAWEIYIWEVLAESKRRFASRNEAWLKVEEFICVAQSKDSFHAYFNHHLCANSFFVACNGKTFIHPCKYETVKSRDNAKDKLLEATKEYFKNSSLPFLSETDPGIIYDKDGNELAKLSQWQSGDHESKVCKEYFKLVNEIFNDPVYEQNGNVFSLLNKSNVTLAQSVNSLFSFEEWKIKLFHFAYYFPVTENADENFCVEIKLPHFNHFGDDIANDEPCGCGNDPVESNDKCYIAWKSNCCFNTCYEALKYYFDNIGILKNYQDYRNIFYCDCNGFGIELIPDVDIIAINPQSYLTDNMDCDAIKRAKSLINAEGLHVVEHILLRPRCKEDCECECLKKNCNDGMDCSFTWETGDKNDPCNNPVEEICFVPGIDPYSFIATIALPAWPERFRTIEARNIIENLLQREAPAHVLLRILWLTPYDLCRFESHFRKWNYWLTWDKHCIDDYKVCDFPTFLFTHEFKCLNDCNICLPCKENIPPIVPCFTDPCDQPITPAQYEIVNQINEIFCWGEMECEKIEREKAVAKQETKNKNVIDADGENKIDERFTKYRTKVKSISENISAKNDLAGIAVAFLNVYPPKFELYKEFAEQVIKNEKPKGKNKAILTSAQRKNLIAAATFYFLDALVFNEEEIKISDEMKLVINDFKKVNISPDYNDWNAKEVREIKSSVDTKIIYRLLK